MSAYTVTVNGQSYTVYLKARRGASLTFSINDKDFTVPIGGADRSKLHDISISLIPKGSAPTNAQGKGGAVAPDIKAPLPGIISDVKVKEGDKISAGATLVVIEAMKMENPIKTPADVHVTKVHVKKGQEVAHGALLVSVEPSSGSESTSKQTCPSRERV
jgi:biotin carboxyl carrier protein